MLSVVEEFQCLDCLPLDVNKEVNHDKQGGRRDVGLMVMFTYLNIHHEISCDWPYRVTSVGVHTSADN